MKSQSTINVIIIDSQSVVRENAGAGESCVHATLTRLRSVGPYRCRILRWMSKNEYANFWLTPKWTDTRMWHGVCEHRTMIHLSVANCTWKIETDFSVITVHRPIIEQLQWFGVNKFDFHRMHDTPHKRQRNTHIRPPMAAMPCRHIRKSHFSDFIFSWIDFKYHSWFLLRPNSDTHT